MNVLLTIEHTFVNMEKSVKRNALVVGRII
jgi:hypothetical protein